MLEIGGFRLSEAGLAVADMLWLRGVPLAFLLARDETDSRAWCGQFIQTFAERGPPQLGFNIPAVVMWRFWVMLARYHG